jgi:hypothetical protein
MKFRSYIAMLGIALMAFACSRAEEAASDHFEVIIIKSHAGFTQFNVRANQDSLIITAESGEKRTLVSRELTSLEKGELSAFLGKLNLKNFKPKYKGTEGGGSDSMTFDITIEKEHSTIHTSNFYVKELGVLVKLINGWLPEDAIIYKEG